MNKKIPVTLKTIAQQLGVTPTTVSKALRDKTDVSSTVKEQVKKLAEELDYRPNLMARSLAQKRTNTIGVIVPEIATTFFALAIRGIYKAARQKGYEIIIMISDENEANEKRSLQYLSALPVDGLLVAVSQETADDTLLQRIYERGTPIVFYDRTVESLEFSSVTIDDRKSAFTVVEHLMQRGCQRIAYVGPTNLPLIAKRRYQGYREALLSHNVTPQPDLLFPCKVDYQSGYQAVKAGLCSQYKPDGIFCMSDLIALGAYRAILEAMLRIPDDIALAGFGDYVVTALLQVPITTVHQPAYEIGQKAVEILVEEINAPVSAAEPRHIILQTELIGRASTGVQTPVDESYAIYSFY